MNKILNIGILTAAIIGATHTRADTMVYNADTDIVLALPYVVTMPPAPAGTTNTHVSFASTIKWQPHIETTVPSTIYMFPHVWVGDGTTQIDAYGDVIYHNVTESATFTDVETLLAEGDFVGSPATVTVDGNFSGGYTEGFLTNTFLSDQTIMVITYTYVPQDNDDHDKCHDKDKGHDKDKTHDKDKKKSKKN
jgi:hypothetical protein